MTDPTVPPIVTKKPFPEDRAIKLAAAREKALEVRRKNAMLRRKDELEKINAKLEGPKEETPPPPVAEEPVAEEQPVADEDVPAPVPEDEPVEEVPKVAPVRKKKNKRQMVVVEQSSDDSDEFESNDRIVFVKRVRKKKETPAPPPAPAPEPPPRAPEPAPRPQLTPEQQQIQAYYNTMFSGGFTNPGFGRRR